MSSSSSHPINVTASSNAFGEVNISWEAPIYKGSKYDGSRATILRYTVEYDTSPIFDNPYFANSLPTTIELKGLNPPYGTEYYFRIIAHNDSDKPTSKPSYVVGVIIKTPSTDIPPTPPSRLRLINLYDYDNVMIGWDRPGDIGNIDNSNPVFIEGYKIVYSSIGFFQDATTLTVEDITRYTFRDLSPNTKYFVRVITINNSESETKKYSIPSEVLEFTTPPPGEKTPSPPRNFICSDILNPSHDVVLNWYAPSSSGRDSSDKNNATLIKYIVEYSISENFSADNTRIVLGVDNLNTRISDLLSDTNYFFRIAAINDNEDRNTSAFTTLPQYIHIPRLKRSGIATRPSAPENITLDHVDPRENATTLSWTAPTNFGSQADGVSAEHTSYYIVETSDKKDFSDGILHYTSYEENAIIRGLKVGTQYYSRIRVNNGTRLEGTSLSNWAYLADGFRTPAPIPPDKIHDLTASIPQTTGKNCILLTWTPPENQGFRADGITEASIVGYEIFYSSDFFRDDIHKINVISPSNSVFMITDLTPNTTYYVYIEVLNDNPFSNSKTRLEARSDHSNITISQTLPDAAPPTHISLDVIPDPSSKINGRTKLLVHWNPPENTGRAADGSNAGIIGYQLEYKLIHTNPYTKLHFGADEHSIIISGLKPDSNYLIRILPINVNYNSDFKAIKKFAMPLLENVPVFEAKTNDFREDPLKHAAPTLTTTDATSSLTLKIPILSGVNKWGKNNLGIPFGMGSRILQFKKKASGTGFRDVPAAQMDKALSMDQLQLVTISGLESASSYAFRIIVTTNFGYSEGVTSKWFTPPSLPASAPGNLQVNTVDGDTHSLKISWERIAPEDYGGRVINYVVSYYSVKLLSDNPSSLQDENIVNSDVYATTIKGLIPGVYNITVNARNIIGDGEMTNTVLGYTVYPPDAPEVTDTAVTTNSITLSWDLPDYIQGDKQKPRPDKYTVYIHTTTPGISLGDHIPGEVYTTDSTVTFDNLKDKTSYTFIIEAENSLGMKTKGLPITVSTK